MTGEVSVAERYEKSVMSTYAPWLTLVRGQGTRVWDDEGKVYLDFTSGIAVVTLGHCHPEVVEAISRQAATLGHVSNLFYNERQAQLAARLNSLSLGGKSFFCNSGAEANEGMIKLARLWGHADGRYEIITMERSFHGRTLATAAATAQAKVKQGFDPLPEGFVHVPFNDLEAVSASLSEKTVAVLLEPLQGEGGVYPADDTYLVGLRKLCDERNLLLLCDEVQCGIGRTGRWFGYQHSEVKPDALGLAKALGNGFPVGAIVAGPHLADVFQPGNHATTFGGTPLACAAALAVLDVIERDGLVQRADELGKKIKARLQEFVDKYERVEAVRGRGLLLGLQVTGEAKPLTDMMMDVGLLTIPTAGNVVRLLPPLTVKDAEVEEALEIMEDCLDAWHGTTEAAVQAVATDVPTDVDTAADATTEENAHAH